MKKLEKFFALTLALVLLAALLAGCGQAATEQAPAAEAVQADTAVPPTAVPPTAVPPTEVPPTAAPAGPVSGGTLIFATNEEPDTLDEQKSNFAVTDWVVASMGAALVSKDIEGNYIPWAAENWEGSPDGLTWTFHLNPAVKFHNGDPVTANDWVFTINRVRQPDFVSPITASMFAPIVTAEATDDYTLVFHLDKPFYPLLENMTSSGYCGVISQRAVEEGGDQYGWTVVVGAGPYRFKEWVQDESITIEANPDYTWGPVQYEGANTGVPYISEMTWKIVPDYATILASLEAGEIDYAGVDPKDVATIEATNAYNIVSGQASGIWYLEFNLSKPPFNDVHVRRAFNFAINRDEIIQVVRQGEAVKVLSPLSPAMIGYWAGAEEIGLDYNAEKAKEELQLAGYTYDANGMAIGPDGQPFTIDLWTISGDEQFVKWSQVMQGQFAAIGVTVNIQQEEWGTLAARLTEGTYEMDTMGVGWPEADILYMMFQSQAAWWNHMGEVPDANLDALLEKTRSETDPAARQQAVDDTITYIIDNAYIAPVLSAKFFVAVDKNIDGWIYSPFTGLLFQDAYFTNLP